MSRPRCLDLFCGAGGAAIGLHRAGFDVTGIDNRHQPRYPFRFIQADALRPPVRFEDFDLIWASPPCQGYSRTRHLPWLKGKDRPLLIPAVRQLLRGVKASVIENVGDAPLSGPALTGSMFALKHRRLRRFECSFLVMTPAKGRELVSRRGSMFGHGKESRLAVQDTELGVDWMVRSERTNAVPPAYAEHIGRYAMMALGRDPDEESRPVDAVWPNERRETK